MDGNEHLRLLRSIDRRLALLTAKEERDVRRALVATILTTPAREAMWDAIDGQVGSPDLSRLGNVSERAAQLFVKDVLDAGLVKQVANPKATIVERDDDAIVQWYLSREHE
jgi:hypothetical protein